MEHEIIISDFLDGALSAKEEEGLFSELSQSMELRQELKNQISIKSAIQSDTKAFTPKADSTMSIFSELGFSPSPAPISFWQKAGNIISSNKSIILSSISSAAITALIFILFWNRGDGDFDDYNSYTQNKLAQIGVPTEMHDLYSQDIKLSEEEIASLSTIEGQSMNNQNANQAEAKIVYKYIYLEKPSDVNTQLSNSNLAEESKKQINNWIKFYSIDDFTNLENDYKKSISNLGNKNEEISDFNSISINNGATFTPSFAINDANLLSKLNISVEFAGTTNYFAQDVNIEPGNEQVLNNTSFAVYFQPFDDWQFGLDYRRENFYQVFRGFDELGNLYEYEQQPNFQTYGINARYMPELVSNNILQAFISSGIAVNNVGVVGRIGGGVIFYPNSFYSFILGIENSTMRFEHQNAAFYTNKYGINFGFSVNF